jgi:hypothetical protein
VRLEVNRAGGCRRRVGWCCTADLSQQPVDLWSTRKMRHFRAVRRMVDRIRSG